MDPVSEFLNTFDNNDFIVLVNQLPVAITVISAESGKLIYANQLASELMGYTKPLTNRQANFEAKADLLDELGKPMTRDKYPSAKARSGKSAETVMQFRIHGSDQRTWIAVKSHPIYKADHLAYVVNVAQDITQLKEAETQLKDANRRITNIITDMVNRQP